MLNTKRALEYLRDISEPRSAASIFISLPLWARALHGIVLFCAAYVQAPCGHFDSPDITVVTMFAIRVVCQLVRALVFLHRSGLPMKSSTLYLAVVALVPKVFMSSCEKVLSKALLHLPQFLCSKPSSPWRG